MTKRIDLAGNDAYSLVTTIKKDALQDERKAMQMYAHGYRFPTHSKKPAVVRQFVCWDGEGITYDGDKAQSYVLFGASTGDRIIKPSLGTKDCFDLLLAVETVYPDAIHVGFALQYDCNMMLRDLSRRHLERLYRTNKCRWNGYRIEYRPGKWFSVRRYNTVVRLFDVFGFFQSSFVKACENFLGASDPELVRVKEGKLARRSFTYDQLDTFIVPYWEAELRLLLRLMDSLRSDLESAGIHINSWHGPGAVANVVMRTRNVHRAKGEVPSYVNRAAQYAYAGGRFELFRCGHYPHSVFEYDINSAYPSAIARLPNLARGVWRDSATFQPGSYGVWLVEHDDRAQPRRLFTKAQPCFYRDRNGNVSYPPLSIGWYWTPEAELVANEVVRGYVFEPDTDDMPFSFVPEMYAQRKAWKAQGNSAERALKLALNSLYGKMAQRIGYTSETGLPRWHQLEWAGYVTSATRAKLWQAMKLAGNSLIAVETDAVFTTKPLPLECGSDLGQWEATEFDKGITYLQSGVYFTHDETGTTDKYRGFDKGSLSYDDVMQFLASEHDDRAPAHLYGVTTRFIGLGIGLHTKAVWRSWVTEPRRIVLGGGGKRSHVASLCPQCKAGVMLTEDLHTLSVITGGGRSHPHALPWLSDDDTQARLRIEDELSMW